MELEKLLKSSGDYAAMLPGNYPPSHAYRFGELIVERIGWHPNLDLHKIIESRGGTVHYVDYAVFRRHRDVFLNSIYVRTMDDFDVILPAYARWSENRFTLAHELGHYVLHAKKSPQSYARRNGDTPVERQADCFALGFLLPSSHFRLAFEKYKTVTDLSIAFQVPDFAIRARAYSLDIRLNDDGN